MTSKSERPAPAKREPSPVSFAANEGQHDKPWRRRLAGECHVSALADRTNVIDGPWWFGDFAWLLRRWRLEKEMATAVSDRVASAPTDNIVHLSRRGAVVSVEFAKGGFDLFLIPPRGVRLALMRNIPTRAWAEECAKLARDWFAQRDVPCRIAWTG